MKLLSKKYPENTRINNLFMRTDCLRYQIRVTIQNWRIDYHVSFPYLRAKLKT